MPPCETGPEPTTVAEAKEQLEYKIARLKELKRLRAPEVIIRNEEKAKEYMEEWVRLGHSPVL